MKHGRKILSILLALVMALSLLPTAAFAAPEDETEPAGEELTLPLPDEEAPDGEAPEGEETPAPADEAPSEEENAPAAEEA
ncbi:MAG: hypothetical protein IJM07_01365, partial [Pyramidobacter sp.]|nr:hypothetical protein [Pyramidobacter sp.]